ncbi:hypothetical protein Tco_0057903 [Tanacetum coccineum]
MAALKFASSHNMVAFLDKPTESDGFEQIVDFLNAHPIKYALTVNPTIYTSCIEQFWTTAKVKTVNGEVQIQALVDKKKVIITETSIRSDLQLEDAEVLRLLLGTNLVALWPLLSSVLPQTKNFEKEVSTAEVTTDSATTTTVDELTLAQTLIEIKAAKPKARGIYFSRTKEEQGELTIEEKSRLFVELMNKRKEDILARL